MKENKNNKTKMIFVRLEEAEYDTLINRQKKTTERNLSAYIRKILAGKPMIKSVQNESLHEVIVTLSLLQKDLNGIGNNYNQMVKRLHTTDKIPEIKVWMQHYLDERQHIIDATITLKEYLDKTAQKWLQE
ncbi:plasmid mobilization protein [Sphingobacterium sp. UGAL515B_05]|uniref:plasmid mobilization protein n=1 Tax=Sphingobacterium sp. UGAL515B_05 TaxID=2986767 RepID=UPI0029545178|nr:plasmid mobilization relaxosome protein MobC [Sphingobacterium sp. UGAL515B_05]WON93814.1 plasmid mobilization relaxosome protein MobC [Sphingobacterium sp. UGAL515B_05]